MLDAGNIQSEFVQQVIHEVKPVDFTLLGGQVSYQEHYDNGHCNFFLERVLDDLQALRLIGNHYESVLVVLNHEVG